MQNIECLEVFCVWVVSKTSPKTVGDSNIFGQNHSKSFIISINTFQTNQPNETKPNDRQYPPNRNRPIIKQQQQHGNQEPLLSRRQPQIIPAAKKQQQQQYYHNQPQHLQQPFLNQNQFMQV